jgi:hypothetical protein
MMARHVNLGSVSSDSRRPNDQVFIRFTFEEALTKEAESLYLLPANWNRDTTATQSIGARWIDDGSSAVLSVPSAAVPIARN